MLERASTTEEVLIEKFKDAPVMLRIAACESSTKQFNENGTLVKNWNANGTFDEGVFEINSKHIKEAKILGYDPATLKGNIGYARYLYDKNGLFDWLSSWNCWGAGGTGTLHSGRSATSTEGIGTGQTHSSFDAVTGENVREKSAA